MLGLEYTVNEGDEWWSASDEELIEKGKAELEALGLVPAADVEAGYVVRMPKAYPVYDDAYQVNVDVLRYDSRTREATTTNRRLRPISSASPRPDTRHSRSA